jgi:hypothetical protein
VTDKHSAKDSALGYLFQLRYALLCGIRECKTHISHSISIEQFDDIALDSGGSPFELMQAKHSINPGDMGDASVSVWKTLGIWSKKVKGNPVAASDQRFILVTTANAPLGSALSKLRRDGTQRDVVGATETLLAVASSSKNQSTATARQLFAALEPELLKLLIGNVWVFDNSPNIIDVRDELEQELAFAAPRDQINNYTDYLEGWWCSRIIECLAGLQDQSIQLYAIRNKIDELRDAFKFGNLPLDENIEKMPAVDTLPNDNRMIIRQMRLIGIPDNIARSALHDFYRASEQRSKWARQSLLLDGEVEKYDRALQDAWQRQMDEKASLGAAATTEQQAAIGKQVFHWSRNVEKPLRNRAELWVSAGSFQMLSDSARIGWHPEFNSHLLKRRNDEST